MRTFLFFTIVFIWFIAPAEAATYYVKNTGNDSNTGLSDAQAWKTIAKVNAFSFTAGDDVYFKEGDEWQEGNLKIDWAGVSVANRSIIGSYYMNGGTETTTVSATGASPIIRGSYNSPSNYGSVPSGPYGGLVVVKADYIHIKNLDIRDSAGFGILVSGSGDGHIYTLIEDNNIQHTVNSFIMFYEDAHYAIVRNNTGSQGVWGRNDGDSPLGSAHPACIVLLQSDYNLIEGNVLHDLYCEGINNRQSSYGIVRANTISNGRHVGIYGDSVIGMVIEHNLILGNGQISIGMPVGISITTEGTADATYTNATGNLIRNNYISGVESCFTSSLFNGPKTAGWTTGGWFVGNTCVGADYSIRFYQPAANYSTWEISNNLFWDMNQGASACSLPTDTDITVSHQSWDTNPTDTDCDGTGDVYGDPVLNTTSDFRYFGKDNLPTATDYEPTSGSNTENVGKDWDSTVALVIGNYPQNTDITYPTSCASLDLNVLETDANCSARHATTPDIGALEIGGAPAPSATITIPFANNVAGPQVLNCIGTTTCEAEQDNNHATTKTGTSTTTDTITNAVNNTAAQTQYGSRNYLQWNHAIANGTYDVTFYISETYWGDEAGTCSDGKRTCDITIEGIVEIDELDACKAVGNVPNTEAQFTASSVVVSDGSMDIVATPGQTAEDDRCEIQYYGIVTAAPLTDTLTLNNSSPTITLVNNYPDPSYADIVGECGANSSAEPDTITIDSISCGSVTGTIVNDGNGVIEFTPDDATTGNMGQCTSIVLSDLNGTESCTPTFTLTGGLSVSVYMKGYNGTTTAAAVPNRTDLCWWAFRTDGSLLWDSGACDETSDSNGLVTITSNEFTAGETLKVYIETANKIKLGTERKAEYKLYKKSVVVR